MGSGETSRLPSRPPEDAEGISLVVWSAMNTVRKALVVVAVLGAGAGVGSTLFALVTPGELQKQAMLQEFPERDPRRREEAARTKELVMATLKKASATEENVAWRKNWTEAVSDGSRSA
ncbi:ubiquinol-cytochrome-c reductase complex assembly factor 3 isoform X3 [Alexandromys fortis]|uniref:ubiquinol-cytochrome-c reductase complex assembly factor 3 isoform X3 n=1 Tax=Alexandromys fortis TaxID=100897 RepID=UPI002152888A|nr:ubiquinol-cytochrome-c reductase complex assembly factor 3 isoform X3 [Microtus fortis]